MKKIERLNRDMFKIDSVEDVVARRINEIIDTLNTLNSPNEEKCPEQVEPLGTAPNNTKRIRQNGKSNSLSCGSGSGSICSSCSGTGKCEDEIPERFYDCEICNGTGKLSEPKVDGLENIIAVFLQGRAIDYRDGLLRCNIKTERANGDLSVIHDFVATQQVSTNLANEIRSYYHSLIKEKVGGLRKVFKRGLYVGDPTKYDLENAEKMGYNQALSDLQKELMKEVE